GLAGVDTRALTRRIRTLGAPNAVIAHDPKGEFDISALLKQAQDWPGLEGMDLARQVSREKHQHWEGGTWQLSQGYTSPLPLAGGAGGGPVAPESAPESDIPSPSPSREREGDRPHVVAVDYGSKD